MIQGNMPFGYKLAEGKIQFDEPKATVVKTIFADYLAGKSTRRIAKQLAERGCLNGNNKPSWSHGSVGNVLENVNYLGDEFYPQLIERGCFEQVQKLRKERRVQLGRGIHPNSTNHQETFSGMLRCGQCGEGYRKYKERSSRKAKKSVWRCKRYLIKDRVCCRCGFLTDEQIEKAFVAVANRILTRMQILDRKPAKAPVLYNREFHRLNQRIQELEAEGRYSSPELPALLFKRAQACYQTAQIDDTDYQTGKLKQAFSGRQLLGAFDRELFRATVKQATVYTGQRLVFEWINGLTMETGY
ncbi:recombinase-like zinc beta ribbon protein [Desulfitobacterium sp. LBE]|uniref:recombinase family protein n=1 Tax=Desulfitobacterium sp. LBE TaxID=884086 RepID=UPI00119A747E|nr:recombinase family protein [Desulfitobacterium sp. LBE]TWH59607.1 recombinase-like zinc beta ribbon protein [Desulfitobacterium sp. LBE]